MSRMAAEAMVTPARAAALLGVNPKTVARWRRMGLLDPHVMTLGGHPRYPVGTVNRMAADRGVGERLNAAGLIITALEATGGELALANRLSDPGRAYPGGKLPSPLPPQD